MVLEAGSPRGFLGVKRSLAEIRHSLCTFSGMADSCILRALLLAGRGFMWSSAGEEATLWWSSGYLGVDPKSGPSST